jgi:hypothetical protein
MHDVESWRSPHRLVYVLSLAALVTGNAVSARQSDSRANPATRDRNALWLTRLLQPLGGDLALRLSHAPALFVHVRHYVVPERRDARLRVVLRAALCPLLGAGQVAGLEERLGEMQVAGAERRLDLDELAEIRDRIVRAAEFLQQLRGVERRAEGRRGGRELRLIGVDRLVELSPAFMKTIVGINGSVANGTSVIRPSSG